MVTVGDGRGNVARSELSHVTWWHSFRIQLARPINLKGHMKENHTAYPCITKFSNENITIKRRRLVLYLIVQSRKLCIVLEYNHRYYPNGTKMPCCKDIYWQMYTKMGELNSRHFHITKTTASQAKSYVISKTIKHLIHWGFIAFPRMLKGTVITLWFSYAVLKKHIDIKSFYYRNVLERCLGYKCLYLWFIWYWNTFSTTTGPTKAKDILHN